MDFDMYIESEFGEAKTLIPQEKLEELKRLFEDKKAYFELSKKNIENQFKNPDIDYSTDYNKNFGRSVEYGSKLKEEVEAIKKGLGITSKVENQSAKR